MKKNKLSILVGIGALAVFPLRAEKYPEKEVKIFDCRVSSAGDTLTVSFTADLNGLEIGPQEQWEIQPLAVAGSDTCRLPALTIVGKTRDKVNLRKAMLAGNEYIPTTYYRVITPDGGKIPVVKYRQQIPARPWMEGAQWILTQTVVGCCACSKPLGSILLDYTPPQAKDIQAASSVP